MTQADSLDRLFCPRALPSSVLRQCEQPEKFLLRVLIKHGFEGRVYPVTRTHGEVEGFKAYTSISELPKRPTLHW